MDPEAAAESITRMMVAKSIAWGSRTTLSAVRGGTDVSGAPSPVERDVTEATGSVGAVGVLSTCRCTDGTAYSAGEGRAAAGRAAANKVGATSSRTGSDTDRASTGSSAGGAADPDL